MKGTPQAPLVGDACVLIDLAEANEAVLALIATQVAPIIIATPVLAEIHNLDELKCAALGITVVEPTLEQIQEAAAPHAALSFADKVCLIVARDSGATCWTNDGPLGDECAERGIPRMRGLRPILLLIKSGGLSLEVAIGTVRLIGANNPYITPAVVSEFERLAKEVVVDT